ncbi:MAG: MogA/MoaB family molybdenum cofactor biosynthesis protein [Candidatus Riflebacteria bacterium]|jgi:molybdenum cofactor biosynthesis protein B|nr:MogA/MoaB family molybdenum cofactor biosynthesis protein [Candidatus Riflebacteria bacterium]
MGHHEHEKLAAASLKIGVMTFSDTRSEAEDKSGTIIRELLADGGHQIVCYQLVREDPELMTAAISEWLQRPDIDAIITNGGTGLTARDGTVEVARSFFKKELEGFGELFRLISYHQIGAAAMLSRATAGLAHGKMLVCLPGSSKAVRLAVTRLLLPQLPHMIWEIRRQSN